CAPVACPPAGSLSQAALHPSLASSASGGQPTLCLHPAAGCTPTKPLPFASAGRAPSGLPLGCCRAAAAAAVRQMATACRRCTTPPSPPSPPSPPLQPRRALEPPEASRASLNSPVPSPPGRSRHVNVS
ncbi:hypothetical protein BS50DRAFT_659885, partial [Corynespora cassiicola Philippines]